MHDQFDLFASNDPGADFRPAPTGTRRAKSFELFLALRPLPIDISRMHPDIQELQRRVGSGAAKAVRPDLWHITMTAIAKFDESFPRATLDLIEAACASVTCRVIQVVHERLMSFRPSGACALLCTAETAAAIRGLRVALATALKNFGVPSKASSTPHLTIFYDRQQTIAGAVLDAQLGWQAVDLSLVVSHQGLGHHEIVRSWKLQA